ncbi:MAG TPA: tyrosine-type recombinase/integrase [Streptosporangiaceae bacterium]|jgi:site-specific recombinase XerD
MAARTTSATVANVAQRPLKNPLRVAGLIPFPVQAREPEMDDPSPEPRLSGPKLRQMQISQFVQWLRTHTNKHKRPFSERAIEDYAETAHVLDRWMAGHDPDGDFTACDTDLLNRFFADYLSTHTQGGTNTRQRNLHHLFKWLARAHGHPDPWTADLVRYGPSEVPPSTLALELIQDLLQITGNGSAKGFADIRDHAIIRMLTEGVRREELAQQQITDLPENLIQTPYVRVVPLKGDRASSQGRLVPLSMATANALASYLRARQSHKLTQSSALWLGSRNRGRMTGSGVYQMLQRRAEQAGYNPVIRPHQFRHTFANDWQMGRIASGASFRRLCQHALPAPQRAALPGTERPGARDGAGDLRLHGQPGSDATMMRQVRLRCKHHWSVRRCFDASDGAWPGWTHQRQVPCAVARRRRCRAGAGAGLVRGREPEVTTRPDLGCVTFCCVS